MYKLPYETASSTVEPGEDVILFSAEGENAYFDPWGIIKKLDISN